MKKSSPRDYRKPNRLASWSMPVLAFFCTVLTAGAPSDALPRASSGSLKPADTNTEHTGIPTCTPLQSADSGIEEGGRRAGALDRSGPPILHQLEILGNRFPEWLQSLQPIGSLARAPFTRRARVRLGPGAMNQVALGEFSTGDLSEPAGSPNPQKPLRIVSWNIERGLQYDKIVQVLKEELQADIYFLQEVDRDARRTEFRDVAASLACELGMQYAYGIEFQELTQGRPQQPALHGQATLSRFPITEARVLRFSSQPKDWSRDWFQPREGGRMALVTKIRTSAGPLLAYNTHLESRGSDAGRAEQMEEILADLRKANPPGPVLLAGDLNTGLGLPSPVFEVARSHDVRLIPFLEMLSARDERRQKDWILGAALRSEGATLHHRISASDHKPVSALIFPER